MEAQFKAARTLTSAMIAAVFLYALIAFALKGQGYGATSEGKMNFMRMIVAFVVIVQIMLAFAMHKMMGALKEKKRLITFQVMVNVFCEAIALFGLVLFFMSKNFMDYAIFAVISLGAFACFFPRRKKWITDSDNPNRGI